MLGLALIFSREPSDKEAQKILVMLLKEPTFVPEPLDFESIVKVCRATNKVLLLKAFVQAYQNQFIFSSYSYEVQRVITRLLLGLTSTGEYELFGMFDQSVTLKRPYQLLVLFEALENSGKISQIRDIAKDLLTHLTAEQLVLVSFIDRNIIHSVITTDEMLSELR